MTKKETEALAAPEWYVGIEQKFLEAMQKLEEAKQEYENIRQTVQQLMESDGLTRVGSDLLMITRVPETTQTIIDKKKLMNEFPTAYEATASTKTIKGSIRAKLLKQ